MGGQLGQGTFGTDDPEQEMWILMFRFLFYNRVYPGHRDDNFDSGIDTDGDELTVLEILYGTSITKNDSNDMIAYRQG